jgi:hypothetical protein
MDLDQIEIRADLHLSVMRYSEEGPYKSIRRHTIDRCASLVPLQMGLVKC